MTTPQTIIYVSQNTDWLLQRSDIDLWFPETCRHPVELTKIAHVILGRTVATHSQTLLNLIGHEIGNGHVDRLAFEVRVMQSENAYRVSGYDEQGFLDNWPMGFFELPLLFTETYSWLNQTTPYQR